MKGYVTMYCKNVHDVFKTFLWLLLIDVIEDTSEAFVFNTKLAFLTLLYNIDIESFKKFQQKIKLLPVRIEVTTPTITG